MAESSIRFVRRVTKYRGRVNCLIMGILTSCRCLSFVIWAGWVVSWLSRVAGLNHEFATVPIQACPVDHVLTIGVEAIPLAIEPVFEVTDEEVLVADAEEAAGYTFVVLEAGVNGVQQFSLPVLLAEDVFVGPSVPVGDRLPSGGAGNEFRQFYSLSIFLTRGSVNSMVAYIADQPQWEPDFLMEH